MLSEYEGCTDEHIAAIFLSLSNTVFQEVKRNCSCNCI